MALPAQKPGLKHAYNELSRTIGSAFTTTRNTVELVNDTMVMARGAMYIETLEQRNEVSTMLAEAGWNADKIKAAIDGFPQ